ncbi:beta strand repeat-containing protein [Azospirillum agricola]|uniref:beta strand repeat-containing protein n=1 Tax=Azospirillum agricola TaxID=1720247 RepID=UPI000A0F3B1F|nr:MBG domain-containing protein [Azospirillum agricola]SMH62922.1 filamentous hemagglutinin family N-terminal domain-containing protein [Azospirillum lipoferum]
MTSVDSQAFRRAGSSGRPSRLLLSLMASVALLASRGSTALAQPLPSGPAVAAGLVSIATPSGTSLIIDQSSPNAIVNWRSFSIGAGNTVHVNNGGGATLNRVTGNVPSRIDGSLTATGSVYLINPAGVAVGPGGRVATGGSFVASTLDVRDAEFLRGGDKTFSGTSKATVTNAGSIGSLGGDVALIARAVENTGTIAAPKGTAALAAGYEVLARDGAVNGGKFQVRVGGADTEAKTTGTISAAVAELRANGGNVYALAGNTGGVISATGTSASGGRIYLTAGDDGAVEAGGTIAAMRTMADGTRQGGDIRVSGGRATVTGTLTAKGSAPPIPGVKPARTAGGTVAVTGRAVTVAGTATVDAGGTSGGAVLIGGDYQGGKDARTKTLAETVANAATTTVEAGARLSADGSAGNGGSVVVWSDERTLFDGAISARGNGIGSDGIAGNGGRAEVSGKASLSFHGTADLRAESGRTGSLLLDPHDLTISNGTGSGMSGFDAASDDSVLSVGTLTAALATANVTVSTGAGGSQEGNITVADPVSWSANTTLTLQAAGRIAVNAAVTATGNSAGLVMEYGVGKDYSVTAPITLSGDGATLQIGPTGSLATYTLLHALSDIDDIDFNRGDADRTGNYALAQSLDGDGNTYSNALVDGRFVGTFAGLGNTIANLTIDAGSMEGVGLFANAGPGSIIRDLSLTGGVTGGAHTGGLAGRGSGLIKNVNAAATVTGTNYVGGLIGEMTGGSVTDSSGNSDVTGKGYVGGLIGRVDGAGITLTRVHASGTVINNANSGRFYNGGLVGYNNGGTIESSYATGDVRPDWGDANNSGGLVGENTGTIRDSYATGSVPDSWFAGGLVGINSGNITNSHATGSVGSDGRNSLGGLVGVNNDGTLSNVYATGSVNGNGPVGGLVGTMAGGAVTDAYASGDVSAHWSPVGGLIGDLAWGVSVTRAYATGAVSSTVGPAGGLIGTSGGTVSQAYATGTVDGVGKAGGLIGDNNGTIRDSYATGSVLNSPEAGGLVGSNAGTITNAYATGSVGGDNMTNVGGLVGKNSAGTLSNVYATGSVAGSGTAGGLIGYLDYGAVTDAFASGTVTGSTNAVGGLIGAMNIGSVTRAYATGAVSGNLMVGGLIGVNGGTVTQVYATGSVTGTDQVGGLIGLNAGTVTQAYAAGAVSGSGTDIGGLIGSDAGSVTASYWGTDSTGQARSAGGSGAVGLTTAEMAEDWSLFQGWDWTVWALPVPGSLRPELYGVSGVVGGIRSITYGDDPAGATARTVGDGWWNTVTGTLSVGPLTATEAGAQSLAVSGLSGTFVTGGATRFAGAGIVNPATLTVTAADGGMTYGDTPPTTITYTATGWKNGQDSTLLTGVTTSTAATATSNVGSHATTASGGTLGGAATGNYILSYVNGVMSVTPATLTVTAVGSMTYGDTPPTNIAYTTAGWKNGQGDSLLTGVATTTTATATSDVGSYATSASGGTLGGTATGNYTLSYAAGTMSVTPAALTVTAAGSMTYGDAPPTNIAYTTAGWKNGQDSTLLTGVTTSTTATAASNVGSYATSASGGTLGGAATGNYTLSYAAGTMSVTPAALTVTAGGGSMTYGGNVPAIGYATAGWKNGQDGSLLTGVSTATTATAASNVGSYATTTSGGALGGGAAGNYTILHQSGTLSVTARPITVTADGKSRLYGNANPALTYGVGGDGLVNGDTLSGGLATAAGTASAVGSYAIGQGTLAASSNYSLVFNPGTLSVTARPITVTADSKSRVYGNANPALTYSVGGDGLVNGDTLSGALATGATASSPAGSYAITQGTLAASSNYALSYGAGVLTVQQTESANSGPPTNAPPQEVTRQVIAATLPRNMVETTVGETDAAFSGGKPLLSGGDSAPTSDTQSATASATRSGRGNGMREDEGESGCIGGAAGGACANQPHPANTQVGRFLRFFQQP